MRLETIINKDDALGSTVTYALHFQGLSPELDRRKPPGCDLAKGGSTHGSSI